MRASWLICVFMGALVWGQATPASSSGQSTTGTASSALIAQNAAPKSAPQAAAAEKEDEEKPAAKAEVPKEVPLDAVVLTIKGVCPATPGAGSTAKTAAGSKAAEGTKTASKTAAAKKPADCETKITRAQFEKIANGLSSNVTPQLKRQLEQALPRFMAMSEIAKKKGLENTEHYKETLKIAKMQILTQELQREAQEHADNVPPQELETYYKENPEAYEQFSLDRLFIPRYKTVTPADEKEQAEEKEESKDEKELTEDQQKQKEEEQKAKEAKDKELREKGEQELNKLADDLRERAAQGEDFAKLQKEAFEAAGTKVENPTVNLPKVRRTGLPPAHSAVFDLKVGEVSQVISDNGGHYIYKVVSKEELPFDQVKDEIHNKMKGERLKKQMDEYNGSFQVVTNDQYFGPAAGPGGPRGMRPGMMGGRPGAPAQSVPLRSAPAQQGAAPQSAPPAQAPAQAPAPPPSKQN
jgi:hypothetical protein